VADEVESGRTVVVMRNNTPLAVLAPVALMERLDGIDEREEDVRLLAAALVRSVTSTGDLVSLDDLAGELGGDLDED
jgi:antitoxin (DNA-binding transcriptional repressor) of toxin-antitoxin stability system